MSVMVFYEKPGCIGNTRQKRVLSDAGVAFQTRNLLTEAWTPERLRAFFAEGPVLQWFNLTAPAVQKGEINPSQVTEAEALAAMVQQPILIRRPLIETDQFKCSGFDWDWLAPRLGAALQNVPVDLETCPRAAAHVSSCNPPAGEESSL